MHKTKSIVAIDELWDEFLEQNLFTYEELKLITSINGYKVETLNDALYVRYGYRDLEQMLEEERKENEKLSDK